MSHDTVAGAAARRPALTTITLNLIVAAVALALGAGCGSKPAAAGGCAADPFACPMGQTCWPVDERGGFQCLASKGFVAKGDDCELLPGRTACPDGMICLTTDSAPDAHAPRSYCAPFCDPARSDRSCPQSESCESRALFPGASQTVRACVEHSFAGPPDLSMGK